MQNFGNSSPQQHPLAKCVSSHQEFGFLFIYLFIIFFCLFSLCYQIVTNISSIWSTHSDQTFLFYRIMNKFNLVFIFSLVPQFWVQGAICACPHIWYQLLSKFEPKKKKKFDFHVARMLNLFRGGGGKNITCYTTLWYLPHTLHCFSQRIKECRNFRI